MEQWRQRINAENSILQHTHSDGERVAHLAHVYRHERVSMLIRSGSFLMILFPSFPTQQHVHTNTLARHINEWPPLQCSNIRKQRHKKMKNRLYYIKFSFFFGPELLPLFPFELLSLTKETLPSHEIFLSI